MTRKHYVKIAEIIERNTSGEIPNSVYLPDLIDDLCNFFQSENPRFDKDKFVDACNGIGQNWN